MVCSLPIMHDLLLLLFCYKITARGFYIKVMMQLKELRLGQNT